MDHHGGLVRVTLTPFAEKSRLGDEADEAVAWVWLRGVCRGLIAFRNHQVVFATGQRVLLESATFEDLDAHGLAFVSGDCLLDTEAPRTVPSKLNATWNRTAVVMESAVVVHATRTQLALAIPGDAGFCYAEMAETLSPQIPAWTILVSPRFVVHVSAGGKVDLHVVSLGVSTVRLLDFKNSAWYVSSEVSGPAPTFPMTRALHSSTQQTMGWRAVKRYGAQALRLFEESAKVETVCKLKKHWNGSGTHGAACQKCGDPLVARFAAIAYFPPFGSPPCHFASTLIESIVGRAAHEGVSSSDVADAVRAALMCATMVLLVANLPKNAKRGPAEPSSTIVGLM